MVRNIVIENVGTLNLDRLDEDIRAVATGYMGLSRGRDRSRVVLHFESDASDDDIAAAQNLVRTHDPTQKTAEQTLIEQVKETAQSAVGVALNNLTAAQQRALIAVLLWQAGGVAKDGTVKPLGEWVR